MAAAVEMLNISKFYPGVIANSNVSLSVDEGQILGSSGGKRSRKIYNDEYAVWDDRTG